MHEAQYCQIDNRPSLSDLKKVETQRCSRLPGLVLGAAIIGLMLAPLAAVAGETTAATSNQKIENALNAATAARSAYATYFAALGDGCLPFTINVESCGFAFSESRSAGDGGRKTVAPSRSEAKGEPSNRKRERDEEGNRVN